MSDSVREAFEAHYGEYDTRRNEPDTDYQNPYTIAKWGAWQAATAAADEKYRTVIESMQRWIDFHNERADKADAEWRGVVEMLVEAGKQYLTGPTEQSLIMQGWDSARSALINNPTSSLGRDIFESVVDEAECGLREALAQAEKLMGRK
jgi:hypothetical protein